MSSRTHYIPLRRLLVIVSALSVFSIASIAISTAGTVDIILKKSLSGDIKPSVDHREYTVLPGDSLHLIAGKYGIRKITPDFLERFTAQNPHIADPDLIMPGQIILIPTINQEAQYDDSRAGIPGEIISDSPPLDTAKVLLSGKEANSLLSQAFIGIGEVIQDTGTLYFPMQYSGTLSLDSSRYPSVSLENGTMLIIDQHETLPDKVIDLIEVSWPHCRVIQPGRFSSAADLLDTVLDESGFYSVVRQKDLVLGGATQVRLQCDWVLEKTQDSIIDGNIYAINYARRPGEIIPQSILNYARKYNIEIVNLEGESLQTRKKNDIPSPPNSETLEHSDVIQFIDSLLARLGMTFGKDEIIKIYSGEDLGLTLTFNAARLVDNGSRKLVVSFNKVAVPMKELLDEMRVDLLVVTSDTPAEEVVFFLLDALDIRFFGPDIEFFEPGEAGEETFVIIHPGIFTRHHSESLFFTHTPPDENILSYLTDRGVTTIIY